MEMLGTVDWVAFGLLMGKILLIFITVVHVVPIMIWVERKGCALMQDRPGPNRVGPLGLLQPLADVVKFLFKEDPVPTQVNKLLWNLAPFLCLIPACLTLAALPVFDHVEIAGRRIEGQIANLDVAVLYMLAISSLGIYGIMFGGWASNNKFSLMGALRSSAQMISYEIPLGVAAAAGVMMYGTFNLREMTMLQEGVVLGFVPNWGVFYQPLGFLIFFISAFAETNRLPFDLPETEGELVAGFHTEYGAMRFATFFMAEYMNMATVSGLMTAMYFGGWHVPWISDATLLGWVGGNQLIVALIQFGVFFTKIAMFMLFFVWVRWTIPRFRFDQLMNLAWRGLIPLSIVNLVVSAIIMYFRGAP